MLRLDLRIAAGLALAVSLSCALPGRSDAEPRRPTGVVELFTSQGCSSCPPADTVLGELAQDPNVVALAYHVDYWDYLGWRDTLGSRESTLRQQDYGRAFGARGVYTPQAVINGRVHVNGARKSAIAGALMKLEQDGEGLIVALKASRVGDSIVIETGAEPQAAKAHLVLVYFDEARPVEIERGENRGSMITYWNPVIGVQTAGMWHGKATRFELPANEIAKKGGCAALLQVVSDDGTPGAILGATIIRSPDAPSTK